MHSIGYDSHKIQLCQNITKNSTELTITYTNV